MMAAAFAAGLLVQRQRAGHVARNRGAKGQAWSTTGADWVRRSRV